MITVHVLLLNEGTDVWAPFQAEHIRDDIYKIKDSEHECLELQFAVGTLVRCEMRKLSDGDCLVAVEAVG